MELYKDIEFSKEDALGAARAAGRKVVAIGGGTGLSALLLGLKEYTDNITAVVTVTDDGGGSGMIRQEFGVLPPGDIRNCLLALANTSSMMRDVLNYRFTEGSFKGQNFGNLFLLTLNQICGSFDRAVASMNEILAVTGRVLPVTNTNINLRARFEDGSIVTGCNVENAAYSPGNCAERTAFFKAVSEGERDFVAIAIVGNMKDAVPDIEEFVSPCGVCRQVMAEFCNPGEFKIILANRPDNYRVYTLMELLPLGFSFDT